MRLSLSCVLVVLGASNAPGGAREWRPSGNRNSLALDLGLADSDVLLLTSTTSGRGALRGGGGVADGVVAGVPLAPNSAGDLAWSEL